MPLVLNKAQRRLHDLIKTMWHEDKIIRLIILKARQLGACLDPNTKVLTADLRWVDIDNLNVGDEIVSVDEFSPKGRGSQRKMRKAIIEAKKEVFECAIKMTTESGKTLIATNKHRFLMLQRGGSTTRWRKVQDIKVGDHIRYITQTWEDGGYEDGWFGGMLDGEGSLALKSRKGSNIGVAQVKGDVLNRAIKYVRDNGYNYRLECDRRKAGDSSKFGNKVVVKVVLSRMNEIFKLIGKTRPARFIKRDWWEDKGLPGKKSGEAWHKIVSIEILNQQRMVDLQTSTKTYIAEGYVSHNSTYIEALMYALTSQLDNQNALILAHTKDGSNYIFDMSKLYQEKCPDFLRPETKKSNEKKLEFEGNHSQIMIDTAENKEAGRAKTIRLVHLSEKAFFNKRNADVIMLGLSQSVPQMGRTMIIQESTANGFNQFKDDWDNAVQGLTDYIPVFIPWYWGKEYMMAIDETFSIGDPAYGTVTQDERMIVKQMQEEGIDQVNERLQWRRWNIRNNCKGDVEQFKQENPSTPEEAFLASGQCFFDQKELVRQMKVETKPLYKANIVKENFKWVLRKCEDGLYSFYHDRNPYNHYSIGGDACSGSGADNAALVARNDATNEISVVYHGKCDPDELAYRAMILGNYLNNAKVAIENDKFGFAANEKLRTIYGNIYVQRSFNKITNKRVEKFGWDCVVPDSKILTSDLRWVKASSLNVGDKIIGPTENPSKSSTGHHRNRYLVNQDILRIKKFDAPIIRIELIDGKCIDVSNNHPFLVYVMKQSKSGFRWKNAENLEVGDLITCISMWEHIKTYESGRLSGLLCADGFIAQQVKKAGRRSGISLMVSQAVGELSKEINDLWEINGFEPNRKYVKHRNRPHHKTMTYTGVGSNLLVLRALGNLRPNRLIREFITKELINCVSVRNLPKIAINNITKLGNGEVIGIETSEHTLIANGFLSHNTNAITRPMMLSQMQQEIREGSLMLRHLQLLKECLTFIKNPDSGKAEAEQGFNDDLVIATAISGQIRQQNPQRTQDTRENRKRPGIDVSMAPRNAGIRFSGGR